MKQNIRLALIAVAAIVVALVTTTTVRQIRRGQNLSEGERLIRDQKLEQAESLYRGMHESDPADSEAILGLAEIHRIRGEYDRAMELLEPHLEGSSPDLRFYKCYGWVLLDMGEAEKALSAFERLQQDPNLVGEAALGLGAANLGLWQGRKRTYLEEAEIQLNKASNALSADGRVALWQAQLALAQGNANRARNYAETAIATLRPVGEAYLARGRADLMSQNLETAIKDFETAEAEGADRIDAIRYLAQAAYLQGNIRKAQQSLAELIRNEKNVSDDVYFESARFSILTGDLQAAKEALLKCDATRCKPIVQLLLVEVLSRLGEHTDAIDVAANLRRRISIFAPAYLEEARLLMRQGRNEQARLALQEAFRKAPEMPAPTEGLGTFLLTSGDAATAIDYLAPVTELNNSPISAIHNCVVAYLRNGDIQNAGVKSDQMPHDDILHGLVRWYLNDLSGALRAALNGSPEQDWRYGWLAAEMLLRMDRPEDALEWLNRTKPPQSAEASIELLRAVAIAQSGNSEEAQRRYGKLADSNQLTDAEADTCILGLAFCAWLDGRDRDAAVLWDSFKEYDNPLASEAQLSDLWLTTQRPGRQSDNASRSALPNLAGAQSQWLLTIILAQGRPSMGDTKLFIQRFPEHGPALIYCARRLIENRDFKTAAERIREAIALSPKRASLQRLLAAALWRDGDAEGAREALQKAVSLAKDELVSTSELAVVALHKGDIEAAEKEMVKLRAAGGTQEANRLKGLSLASQGQWAEAEPLLQAAIDANPADTEILIAYGVCSAQLGRLKEAEELIQDAIRLSPSHPDGHRLLGQLYASRGLYMDAYQAFQTSLLLNPEQEDVQRLVDKIDSWRGMGHL